MKKLLLIPIIGLTLLSGCSSDVPSTSDKELGKMTEESMMEANRQIGMPNIINYQERKLAKQIFELRDKENLITYTYITSYTGELILLGKSIGYGLPYSVQYTNPSKIVDVTDYGIDSYQSNDSAIIPQADPNGLFMPEGLSATWVMLIDKNGDPRATYIEQEIIVSTFPLTK